MATAALLSSAGPESRARQRLTCSWVHWQRDSPRSPQGQGCVAFLLGVSTETVIHWELGQRHPHIEVVPRIMDLLGYCPYEPAPRLGARLVAIRHRLLGISQEEMARAIGIDPTTLSRIERTDVRPNRVAARKIERCLGKLRRVQALSRSIDVAHTAMPRERRPDRGRMS